MRGSGLHNSSPLSGGGYLMLGGPLGTAEPKRVDGGSTTIPEVAEDPVSPPGNIGGSTNPGCGGGNSVGTSLSARTIAIWLAWGRSVSRSVSASESDGPLVIATLGMP